MQRKQYKSPSQISKPLLSSTLQPMNPPWSQTIKTPSEGCPASLWFLAQVFIFSQFRDLYFIRGTILSRCVPLPFLTGFSSYRFISINFEDEPMSIKIHFKSMDNLNWKFYPNKSSWFCTWIFLILVWCTVCTLYPSVRSSLTQIRLRLYFITFKAIFEFFPTKSVEPRMMTTKSTGSLSKRTHHQLW